MNSDTLPSQEIRIAIPHMPKVARLLLNQGKKYDALLLEILKYDPFSEDNYRLPSNKELQGILKLSSGQIRSQLELLYHDFLSLIDNPATAFNFGNILVQFYVRGYFKKRFSFYVKLIQLPKIGDQLDLPFLMPIFGRTTYYIQHIHHTFENDTQSTLIWVKQGIFNLYEYLELEKAKSENRYDWETDSITMPAAKPDYTPAKRRWRGYE